MRVTTSLRRPFAATSLVCVCVWGGGWDVCVVWSSFPETYSHWGFFSPQYLSISTSLHSPPGFADCGIDLTARAMASDVLELMEQNGLMSDKAQVHLVGHDWGSIAVQVRGVGVGAGLESS